MRDDVQVRFPAEGQTAVLDPVAPPPPAAAPDVEPEAEPDSAPPPGDFAGARDGWLHWTHGLVNRLVKGADGFLLALAGLGAWAIWAARTDEPSLDDGRLLIQAIIFTAVTLGVYLRTMTTIGAYRVENYRHWGKSLLDVVGGLLPSGTVLSLLVWAFLPEVVPSDMLALWGGTALACLGAGRVAAAWGVRLLEERGVLRRRVVILGATDVAERMIAHLALPEHRANYSILGLFDDRDSDRRPASLAGLPVSGDLTDFKRFLPDNRVDMVVIALPWRAAMRIHSLRMQLQMISLDILIPLDEESIRLRLANLRHIGGIPALLVMRQPLRGMQIIVKRIEDVVVAGLGLLVASPFMLAAAIAVRLDSPGPIIFRQTRVGFNNRPFTMLKFRTMKVDDSDDGAVGTSRDNPRITRVGRFLRRTSIDELPQLFNVLAGDMSVVGPRAHVPNMRVGNQRYAEVAREYAARSRVKPGITGWAQINGMRGGIHTVEKARVGVDMDIHYIENWSLWLDAKIIISTVTTGLFGRDVF
ncbi:sugar transferase (plasmid) [Azospirillum baldaniorum]|uniref:Sugar transferase n=1 Tax=Azospirillum baldaniorum TaxID=1064539 RepID=A0A9P1JZ71_9PROT|nr:exopolysaccharide biosynthesis polyprenyl glycosylphosphotransferase [Azospirillum baldaniorum]AWJ92895.1 sugar transferase [Azospirillum baldaniorum]TWA76341.1 putative colanic acid biosynthesis UDP-glucose lipid carrier transferase [Azospirillum brasilense]CCD02541.1 sugar transferase [Azospirillum baldaniorum]